MIVVERFEAKPAVQGTRRGILLHDLQICVLRIVAARPFGDSAEERRRRSSAPKLRVCRHAEDPRPAVFYDDERRGARTARVAQQGKAFTRCYTCEDPALDLGDRAGRPFEPAVGLEPLLRRIAADGDFPGRPASGMVEQVGEWSYLDAGPRVGPVAARGQGPIEIRWLSGRRDLIACGELVTAVKLLVAGKLLGQSVVPAGLVGQNRVCPPCNPGGEAQAPPVEGLDDRRRPCSRGPRLDLANTFRPACRRERRTMHLRG